MHHIGREIHDSVGQRLTLASIYTKQLTGNDERINTISHIIDESLKELRQLSKSLTHAEYINAAIEELLTDEAKKINATGVCHVEIKTEQKFFLSQSKKHTLFRLLQEFIQNSLKHADCKKIKITFSLSNSQLYVKATDDGKGFDLDQKASGIGLYSMKRRADELQAIFNLSNKPQQGTLLELVVPNCKAK